MHAATARFDNMVLAGFTFPLERNTMHGNKAMCGNSYKKYSLVPAAIKGSTVNDVIKACLPLQCILLTVEMLDTHRHVQACTRVHTHTHLCTHMSTHTHAHTCTGTHTHAHKQTHTHMHTQIPHPVTIV
jgi:hypothetical protein